MSKFGGREYNKFSYRKLVNLSTGFAQCMLIRMGWYLNLHLSVTSGRYPTTANLQLYLLSNFSRSFTYNCKLDVLRYPQAGRLSFSLVVSIKGSSTMWRNVDLMPIRWIWVRMWENFHQCANRWRTLLYFQWTTSKIYDEIRLQVIIRTKIFAPVVFDCLLIFLHQNQANRRISMVVTIWKAWQMIGHPKLDSNQIDWSWINTAFQHLPLVTWIFTDKMKMTEWHKLIETIGSGSRLGLSLILNVALDEYYCSSRSGYGFKVLLHAPHEVPLPEFGVGISNGFESRMVATPLISGASKAIRRIPMHIRQCVYQSENFLTFYR